METEELLPLDEDSNAHVLSRKNRQVLVHTLETCVEEHVLMTGPKDMLCVAEFFTPPRLTSLASTYGMRSAGAYDREMGWEALSVEGEAEFWRIHEEEKPNLVLYSPRARTCPCCRT